MSTVTSTFVIEHDNAINTAQGIVDFLSAVFEEDYDLNRDFRVSSILHSESGYRAIIDPPETEFYAIISYEAWDPSQVRELLEAAGVEVLSVDFN